ncbi:sialic acid-binding Ig-like lectin 13 [Genypterus blacodes]|uniref:sialic acid-binding Ig-like lectin 13 n=1 Tax=Genypterus blacodes TaxID=154954 RepID=UPI003F773262
MSGALILLLVGFLSQGALCVEFKVSVPQTIEVFSGSCVTIPCSFVLKQGFNHYLGPACVGIWKDSHNQEVFDSRKPQTSKINGALTGNLKQKDCTTTLYNMQPGNSDTYYFRMECTEQLKLNFYHQSVHIVVKGGGPPRPTLNINQQVVKEGASVRVTCSAAAPCQAHPPTLTWTPGLGDTQETLGTFLKTSALILNATSVHHRMSISCTATYDRQAGRFVLSNNLTLEVLYAPKHTKVTVSPSGPGPEGSNVTLTCSSEANTAVTEYIWFRDDGGQRTIGKGPILNIPTCKVHSSITCKASNAYGSQNAKISLIQFQSAPQIRSSSGCIKHADQVSCSCEAEGVPAPCLLWLLDGFPVDHSDEFAISHESLSDAGARSNITVNQPQERNLSTLVCRTTNSLGTASQRFCGFISESQQSESQDQVPLSVFIGTAVFLTAAFVCSLLFALRAQCSLSIMGQSAGNADPFANSCQMPNRTDEDIYMNCKELQGPHPQPEPIPEASIPQEVDSVLTSSVIWKPKPKKKKEDEEDDCENPSGCSYLEEERCMLGSMNRNSMINSLPVDCIYAQVKFKDKNAAQI